LVVAVLVIIKQEHAVLNRCDTAHDGPSREDARILRIVLHLHVLPDDGNAKFDKVGTRAVNGVAGSALANDSDDAFASGQIK
jgi:hypothetical protein